MASTLVLLGLGALLLFLSTFFSSYFFMRAIRAIVKRRTEEKLGAYRDLLDRTARETDPPHQEESERASS